MRYLKESSKARIVRSSISCGVEGVEHDAVRVPVAESPARELDVRLLRRDVAEAGAAAHHVHEDARQLGPDHVGDALEHQAEPGRRGEGHRPQPRAAAAVHHVDRGHLAHRLDEDAVELRQQLRHQLGALGRRRDGIPEEVPAARRAARRSKTRRCPCHERARLGQRQPLVGDRQRPFRFEWPGAEERRRVHELEARSGFRGEAVGLRAGAHAEAAGGAVLEVQDHRDQAGPGVDLRPHLDAVACAGFDAASAALAVLREEEGLGLFDGRGHASGPRSALKGCKLLASAQVRSIVGIPPNGGLGARKACAGHGAVGARTCSARGSRRRPRAGGSSSAGSARGARLRDEHVDRRHDEQRERTVPMIMPLTSMMPMLLRAPAPGPVASTSGKWPTTVAAVVIRIGRSRVPAASMTAASLSLPVSCRWFANSTIRMPFFADQADQRDEPDLAVDVERGEAEEREQQRARERERHRAGQDDERIAEALELRREHQVDQDRREQERRRGTCRPRCAAAATRPRSRS